MKISRSARLAFLGAAALLTGVLAWGQPGASPDPAAGWPAKAVPLEAHRPELSDSLRALAETGARPQSMGETGAPNAIRVVIEPEGSAAALAAQLDARGFSVEAQSRSLVRVRVSPDRLPALAEVPGVRYARPPRAFQALSAPRSQAVTPLGATLLHGQNVQGQGVAVAVIDVGFGSLEFAQEAGALPASVVADFTDYSGQGSRQGNHGTSVALVVHEMAPKAELYLKQVGDLLDLENAVDDAIRQGADVINHSVGWFSTNFGDGTGFVADLAGRARDAGVLWVNAAGNHALQHWTGRFLDQDGNGWAEFPGSGGEFLRIQAYFGLISLDLTWDDWPRTNQDLDLYLYDTAGNVLASSTTWQLGAEEPVEVLDYFVEQPGVYRVKVLGRRVSGPVRIKLFSQSHVLAPHTPHGSLPAPADARAALAVGAVSIHDWETGPQEPYSSLGPTSDGRIKPDIAGPDQTDNLLARPFGGTSASAPHVAGAAALLWSQHPEWDADQVERALLALVRDLGRPGPDVTYGAGALDLALARPRAERTLSRTRVQPGQTVTVRLEARLPALAFGGLTLREEVPAGWAFETDDPAYDPAAGAWRWPLLDPGASVSASYTLRVPADQPPGPVSLGGWANAFELDGDRLTVLAPASNESASVPEDDGVLYLKRERNALALAVPPDASHVSLQVYDLSGRLVYETRGAGPALRWNGLTRAGGTAANGVYLVHVRVEGPTPRSRVLPVMWLR